MEQFAALDCLLKRLDRQLLQQGQFDDLATLAEIDRLGARGDQGVVRGGRGRRWTGVPIERDPILYRLIHCENLRKGLSPVASESRRRWRFFFPTVNPVKRK